jgi:C_GCAxxG_C_C family probable redox protein
VGSQEVFKAGSALAGGVARRGETCGALLGAILAVCSVVGRERLEDREQYGKAMEVTYRVYDRFKEEIGDTICWQIHMLRYGKIYRLFIPEERVAFHEMGGHSRKGCPEVCGVAARIGAEVLLDIQEASR